MLNIAINTFKEIVRNRFLYMIVFFWLIFIAFSMILAQLSLWEDSKIITDFGLAMIEVFWLIWVLFVWSQLLFKEVEWKTIFLILSKPIKRSDFILGKILGFSATIFLITLFQSIVFLTVLLIKDIEITNIIIWSIINTFIKLEILLAIVFFMSTFMSNILVIASSLMLYLASHSYSLILDMLVKTKNELVINIWKSIQLLFPPLEALNTKDLVWSFSNLTNTYFILNIFYSFLYLTIIIYFTVIIFSRKKFEN